MPRTRVPLRLHVTGGADRAPVVDRRRSGLSSVEARAQVADLAAAVLELVATGHSGPLHVAGADAVSRASLAELVAGRPVRRGPAPAGRPLDCRLDSSRALAILGAELRGVRAVLAG